MSGELLGLVEPVLLFGGLVLFMHWQFRELRQRAEAREKDECERPPGPVQPPPDGADRVVPGSQDPSRHPPG